MNTEDRSFPFSCSHCRFRCQAALDDPRAGQFRCPECHTLHPLPDLLDFALTGGPIHDGYVFD